MLTLEQLLEVGRIGVRDDMYETDMLFNKEEIAPANKFIIDALRKKGRVTLAELLEHYGARTIRFVNYRLASGMDFFVPCDVQTDQPVFDGIYVRMVGVKKKITANSGIDYVDFKDDSLIVVNKNWDGAIGKWDPLIEHDPQQILGKTANGGFTVTGTYRMKGYFTEPNRNHMFPLNLTALAAPPPKVYLPGKISCRLRRIMKMGESEFEKISIMYEVTILEDTPPGKIHRLDLVIMDNLRIDYAHYSIFAEWDNQKQKYVAGGMVQLKNRVSGNEVLINVKEDGHYSEEFRRSHDYKQTDIHDLNILYRFLGDPGKQVDFAATIQNAFDAANTNSMSLLVSKGFLVGR